MLEMLVAALIFVNNVPVPIDNFEPALQPAKTLNRERYLYVSKSNLKMYWVRSGEIEKTYNIAIGKNKDMKDKVRKGDNRTPEGTFKVVQKSIIEPTSRWGSRWMRLKGKGLSWRGIGIHGTNDPAAVPGLTSEGCIRLQNKDVEEIYKYISSGDMVIIHH